MTPTKQINAPTLPKLARPHGMPVRAVDLFCGAGGLSWGLREAGIDVRAGVDVDIACAYPYSHNLGAKFVHESVRDMTPQRLEVLWGKGRRVRVLAGCAPCQPFSSQRKGADTTDEDNWDLLGVFADLVAATRPEFVTMENVPRLMGAAIFRYFLDTLAVQGYEVDYQVLYGPAYGLPQARRRLVLVAARDGEISLPAGESDRSRYPTVWGAIGGLPAVAAGETSETDRLHVARQLSPVNLERLDHSVEGGTWRDWPEELRAPCHRRASGKSFHAFYGRMRRDEPSPTITTQAFNYGTGRFGHPTQRRALTLREAATLQGFPTSYQFTPEGAPVHFSTIGRLIGNAVPPAFGRVVGLAILDSLGSTAATK